MENSVGRASPTLALAESVRDAKLKGRAAISLSTPSFPPIDLSTCVPSRVMASMGDKRGQEALRREFGELLFSRWPHDSDKNLMVTSGAKGALLLLFAALANRGDDIAIVAPAWPTYYSLAESVGLNVRSLFTDLENDFEITAETIAPANGCKILVFSNPNNPTGRAYSDSELDLTISFAKKRGIWIIIDESFSETVESHQNHTPFYKWPYERLIIVNSLSKNYCLQGVRLGGMAATETVIRYISDAQTSLLSPPSRPMQDIVAEHSVRGFLKSPHLGHLRACARDFIRDETDWKFLEASGTFYFFPKLNNAATFRNLLREKFDIYSLDGAIFGPRYKDHIRFCFFRPESELNTILESCRRAMELLTTDVIGW